MTFSSGSVPSKGSQTPAYFKWAAVLVALIAGIFVLHALKEILIPLLFAVLISILLHPVCERMEKWRFPRILAITLSILLFIIVIAVLIYLVSVQVAGFADELPRITEKAEAYLDQLFVMGEQYFGISRSEQVTEAQKYLVNLLSDSRALLLGTLVATTSTLTTVTLVPLYVFFFLLYRDFFRQFVHKAFYKVPNFKLDKVLNKIYEVIQSYMAGLLLVIGIVGILNTIGLLLLGIDYAVFFGFLAAFLILIPYIGILIGSLFPALMSIITEDSAWYALGVVGVMGFVQFLEGNFITPNIVGSKVSVNPLAAIVMLLLGGQLWGLPGLILALPLTAILKVIMDADSRLEPFGFLLGEPGKEVAEEKAQARHPGYYRDPEVTQNVKRTAPSRPPRKNTKPSRPENRKETASTPDPVATELVQEVREATTEAGKEEGADAKKRRRPSRRRKKPGAQKEGETPKNSADQDS
jgi:predicted PurR-regulated permease PerM